MNERPSDTPDSGRDPMGRAPQTPDPHRGEPAPPPLEGLRPEADPALVRPVEDDENPLGGLLHTAVESAKSEVPVATPEAEAELNRMGFEPEGIASGQIFGLMLATALGVASLLLVLYFLFYSPKLNSSREAASDVPADRYVELRDQRAASEELLAQYAVNQDSTYRMPIGRAMQAVAAEYGASQGAAAGRGVATPQGSFNASWVILHPPQAVRRAAGTAADTLAPGAPGYAPSPGREGAAPAGSGSIATEGPPAGVPAVDPSEAAPRPAPPQTGTDRPAGPPNGGATTGGAATGSATTGAARGGANR